MKPAPFQLHTPATVADVVGLLADHGDEAKILAGGQSLVPMMALRLARFEHLVDVNRVGDLPGIERVDGALRIGATTRHRQVELSDEVAAAVPLLSRATARVGHFQIRNRGTVCGALAHADAAAEQPAVALALDAVMEVAGPSGTREVAAAEFFKGTWYTDIAADEMLTAVRFPVWDGRCGYSVQELARRAGDFALAGVVCAVELDGDQIRRAGIGLFGVGGVPVRAAAAEAALLGGGDLDAVAEAVRGEVDPLDDLHASADYRRKVAGVLVKRALTEAMEEAGNG